MNLPPYKDYPCLISDKISLRQILAEDIKDIIEISFYDAIQAKSVQEAAAMQAKIDQDYLDGNSIHWGIEDNKSKKIIGCCGYHSGFANEEGELGCVLMAENRGQGFMSAALLLAINFGLKTIGLKCIRALTAKNNHAAIHLLQKLNFKKIADLQDNELLYELREIV